MALARRDAVIAELRDRIVNGIHVGRFKGGERLASVRALASELEVNERVVLAALRTLSDEGLVDLRPRSGAYVAAQHQAADASLPHLRAWLVGVLVQARSRGLAPRAMPDYVRRCLETRPVRAACIECNRDQLHLLCTELSEDHGYLADSALLEELAGAEMPVAVRRADVLVTTAYHTAAVRRVAKRLGKPCIAVELRPDVMRDVSRQLRQGAVYYVITDPRYERKLRQMLGTLGPVDKLRVLYPDRDDLGAIPPDAPTFLMTSAMERLNRGHAAHAAIGRPIHPTRYFSDNAARDLLGFLIRANMAALENDG